jgi:thiosulfate/3-mercaptopyruvate sulfurtransferase
MTASGIANDTLVIVYGDSNNWFAAWAFWQMKIYGHRDVRLMDGGRKKWISEGRELETAPNKATPAPAPYRASDADVSLRAFLQQVRESVRDGNSVLIDVRSPQEFTGEILAPPGLPETCQRGGTSPERAASPGARPATTMEPSSRPAN